MSLLEDNAGGFSSARLAMLLWTVALLFVFVYTSFVTGKPSGFDGSIVTLYVSVCGLKVVQRFGEKAPEPEKS